MLSELAGVESLASPRLHSQCLLSARCVLDRHLLSLELSHGANSALAIEELSLSLMEAAVRACTERPVKILAGREQRRRRQVETVKEAITLFPDRAWTLDALDGVANASPYHLARVFRDEVGMPVHRYLVGTRRGKALEAMIRPVRC